MAEKEKGEKFFRKLAQDERGIAFDLPGSATSWRVQRMTGQRGKQEVLYDDEAAPLTLPIGSSPAELRDKIRGAGYPTGGRFKLIPTDEQGVNISDKCGYCTIKGDGGAHVEDDERGANYGDAAVIKLADACARIVDKLSERDIETIKALRGVAETLANAMASSQGNLIKGYADVRPVVEQPPPELPNGEEVDEQDFLEKMTNAAPQLIQLLQAWQAFKTSQAVGQAEANHNGNGSNGHSPGLGIKTGTDGAAG